LDASRSTDLECFQIGRRSTAAAASPVARISASSAIKADISETNFHENPDH
jgi:hypothetical protein